MSETGSIKIERTYELLGNIFTWTTDQNVIRALEGTGFDNYGRMKDLLSSKRRKRITHSLPLLSLLVENYNPENKNFVFNGVTLAPTVDDIHHITGLPINGRKPSDVLKKKYQNADLKELCEELLGKVPDDFEKKGILQFAWLRENFMTVPPDVELDSPIIFERYVRAYVLFVIGSTLFPTSSPSSVHASFLECLRVISEIKDFNWSGGVLDYIHTSLGKCNKRKDKSIGGSTYTLLIYFFEHIPKLADKFCNSKPDLTLTPTLVHWVPIAEDKLDRYSVQLNEKLREELTSILTTLEVHDVS